MNVATGRNKGLTLQTNSFCGGGTFLSNGTLMSVGGNTAVNNVGDKSGEQALRFFDKCDDAGCSVQEFPKTLSMTSHRWYPTSCVARAAQSLTSQHPHARRLYLHRWRDGRRRF